MIKLIKTNFGEALMKEKKRDYKNVVFIQIGMIISALLLKDAIDLIGFSNSNVFRDFFFLAIAGLYAMVLWDILRNFTQNPFIIYSLFVVVIGTYVLALITVNPFYNLFSNVNEQRPYLFFIHAMLFIIECTVIYFAILDIFSGNKESQEKLWGSACIFLMIAISFGSLYDLINILSPGAMGAPLPLGMESYTSCITFSMTKLVGLDSEYPNAISLIKKIGIIEAVWANLFVVLLVGRLLGQPDGEN